jgi:hypothetical protein
MNERLTELHQELAWRRAERDPKWFLENYWRIQHPERGSILFELRPAQEYALAVWQQERYSLTLKARQIGWSTLVAAHVFDLAFFGADRSIILISRTEREAIDLLAKVKHGYRSLPEWMKARGPRLVAETQQKLVFANGSSIESMPSANDPARGKAAYLVVVDEWAFLPNAEDAWASIEPVADVGGRVIGLSTANGSGNWFHQEWVKAETGTGVFKPMFAAWNANADRDDAWYAAKKANMPSWQLAQEYPNTPEEAFIKSGNPVFDLDVLAAIEVEEPWHGYLHEITPKNYEYRPSQLEGSPGPLRVWAHPDPEDRYVIGADVAEGLEHGDYSSAHVISVRTGLVAAHWHGHIEPDLFGEELYRLGLWYNAALVAPESNNHGLTVVTALRRLNYPRLYRRRQLNDVNRRQTIEFGWATTIKTKPLLVDELAMSLRNGDIDLRCAYTVAELRSFVRDTTGMNPKMHGSPHDDRVISLGLAVQMLKHASAPEYAEVKDDYWTMDWWMRQAQPPQSDEWIIGQNNVRTVA